MSEFNLSGYPSYLLFDAEGKYHKGAVNGISRIDFDKLEDLLK